MKILRRPSRHFWVLLAFVGISATGIILRSHAARDPGSGRGDGAAVGQPVRRRIVCFGHVDADRGVTSLYPTQPGRVEAVKVEENQEVHAGTVLLSLDNRPADCLVRQAKADLDAAQVQFEQTHKLIEQQRIKEEEQRTVIDAVRFRLKAASLLVSRKEELRGLQFNDKEIEAARAQRDEVTAALRGEEKQLEELKLNDPREALRRAEADVAAKQAQYDRAVLGLNECDLKAPGDGTVLRILVNPGDVLGSQPRQPAMLFCPKGPRVIRAEVEQEFARGLTVGQEASVQDDSSDPTAWKGKIVRISDWYTHRRSLVQEPLQLSDVRTLECVIALEADPGSLRIGQRVRVTVGQAAPE